MECPHEIVKTLGVLRKLSPDRLESAANLRGTPFLNFASVALGSPTLSGARFPKSQYKGEERPKEAGDEPREEAAAAVTIDDQPSADAERNDCDCGTE